MMPAIRPTGKDAGALAIRWQSRLSQLSVWLIVGLVALAAGSGPALAQQRLEAQEFDLADYRGRVVYLDFWASWCPPCRASFPFMAELANRHDEQLAIVAINVDERRQDADAFLQQFSTPFDIVYDPQGALAAHWQLPGMPSSFLLDRQGQLIGSHIGFRQQDRARLQRWVETQLSADTGD